MEATADGQRKDFRREVLLFVQSYLDDNGYPPTYDEIRSSVGLSSRSHVLYYLDALKKEGLIDHTPNTPRTLRLVGATPSTFSVKMAGYIAAGEPLELLDELAEEIEITADIADPRRNLVAVRVKGDSMIEDLVGSGDILIVERQAEAQRGQMAVVHLKSRNAATLKRIHPEGARVRLQPSHPTLPAIYADAADVEVQGRVLAVIRRL
jgi:repressor LexA